MTVELIPLCTMSGRLGPPFDLGPAPSGRRLIFEVLEGGAEGERLSGTMRGRVNGDWLTLGAGGVGKLDVRLLLETHDGALVLIEYRGRFDAGVPGAPLYTAPLFETGDERYGWLNKVQAVAKGTLDGEVLTYEVYEVR